MKKIFHSTVMMLFVGAFGAFGAPAKNEYQPPENFRQAQQELKNRVGELSALESPWMSRKYIVDTLKEFNEQLDQEAKGKLPEGQTLNYKDFACEVNSWIADPYIELDSDVSRDWMGKVVIVVQSMDRLKGRMSQFSEQQKAAKDPKFMRLSAEHAEWRKKLDSASHRVAKPINQSELNALKQRRRERINTLKDEIRILERELPKLERLERQKQRDAQKSNNR